MNTRCIFYSIFFLCLAENLKAQNIGIGMANPQKGKLEIAGALGNHSTVLTIGSDGTGISLQRNWPTIGFNQYRDANNVQRFIGNGHAGLLYLSAVDGSIVFGQFGQGTANQEIITGSVPLFISGGGVVQVNKKINMAVDATITNETKSGNYNLLPYSFGVITPNGSKLSGTNNFTSSRISGRYRLEFTENISNACILVTGYGGTGYLSSYLVTGSKSIEVYFFSIDGNLITPGFNVLVYL